jgi:hypothetical protein
VTDVLPASVSFASADSSAGNCNQSGNTIVCSLGALNNRGSATIAIVVTANAAGSITNTASVTGAETDPAPANNAASAITTVIAAGQATVGITASDPNASEGGANTGAFTVSRAIASNADLVVHYTISGTASNGADYALLASTVTIQSGSTSADISVQPLNDNLNECAETVILTIAPDANYTIGPSNNATVTIADSTLPTVKVKATDNTATEASQTTGKFKIVRTGCTTTSLTVFYSLTGTATYGSDYTTKPAKATSIDIPAGSSSKTITLLPINDTVHEGNETAIINLLPDSAYQVVTPTNATITITSNE